MRIAFSGSGGTGKTTLLQEVNKTLKLPVIEEGVRKYMSDKGITHLRELSSREMMRMQMWLLDSKKVSEGQPNFIADRTTIDNLVYALYWGCREDELQRGLNDYISDCFKHAARSYDVIFLLPYGLIPLQDDGVRSAKPMYQFIIQMVIERFLDQLPYFNPNVAIHTITSTDLSKRTEEVLSVIKQLEEQHATEDEETDYNNDAHEREGVR